MSQLEFASLCARLGLQEGIWDVEPDGGFGLEVHPFEITPRDFLHQAEVDLTHETQGSDQNAFTNAKRAITCVMDQILLTFGYRSHRWNTARKVQTVAAMGVVTPRIIVKVNATRNLLEHSHQSVTRTQAEDAVDIAMLFVAAASPMLRMFPGDFSISTGGDSESYDRSIQFSYGFGRQSGFLIWEYGVAPIDNEINLTLEDASFTAVVALALAADRDIGVDRAFGDLRLSLSVTC